MLSERAIDEAEEVIGPRGDAFYSLRHQVIYRAILALRARSERADVLMVRDFLDKYGSLADAGGEAELQQIAATVPSTSNVGYYARIVVEQAQLREIEAVGVALQQLVRARDGREIDVLYDEADALLTGARDRFKPYHSKVVTAFAAAQWLDERIKQPLTEEDGIPVPFRKLPRLLGGRLYTLGGYQADGKTAVGADFARAAAQAGHRVGFVSMEMSWQDLSYRQASNLGAPAKQVETGMIRPDDRPRIQAAIARLATLPVEVLDDPFATVASIGRFQRLGRYKLLIIDHLHQFQIEDMRHERQEIERILRALVALARAENIPVLLLAQLARVGDPKNPFPRPTMASYRNSGMIEALSWCCWFVWRLRDKKNLPTSEAEFITAKNRSGRTGSFDLVFHEQLVRFIEASSEP